MREALIVGGTGAIGMAIATSLGSKKFKVNLVARNPQHLDDAVQKIGAHATPIVADVMDEKGFETISEICRERKPELLIHAFGSHMEFSKSAPSGGWRECMEMYFFRPVAIDQLLIPFLVEEKRGCILHLSSYATVDGTGFAPYATAKTALNQYIKTEGQTLKNEGVTLTAVMPRAVEGGRNRWALAKQQEPELYKRIQSEQPSSRFQSPQEVAAACLPVLESTGTSFGGQIVPLG